MASGTDKQIFKSQESLEVRSSNGGRPKINRDLVLTLIKQGYSTQYITKTLKVSSRSVRRIEKEAIDRKEIDVSIEQLEKENLDFDEELTKAKGISFYSWLKSRALDYKPIFDFCRKNWELWDKPSPILLKDMNSPLGAQVCMKFLDNFGEDKKRLRGRKKRIRYLFRFLNRTDLCDDFLSMTEVREPSEVRIVPEITLNDFPNKLMKVISLIEEQLGFEASLAIKFKIITQMRTGNKNDEKELRGIKFDSNSESYLIVNDNEIKGRVKAKRNEVWELYWFGGIQDDLKKLYDSKLHYNEYLFDNKAIDNLSKVFGDLTSKIIGRRLKLHDLRKVSFTWFYIMGIPLEVATDLNVGWRDLNTPKKYYLQFRKQLKKSEKEAYRQNIPDWFKKGLEEYKEE